MKNVIRIYIAIVCLLELATSFQTSLIQKIPHAPSSSTFLRSAVLEREEVGTHPPSTSDLPPVLQSLVDERREYELNLGKAMDTLRKDYPYMLQRTPDFDIYHDEIRVVDPSGVQLSGLKNYKSSFSFLQTLVRFFYNLSESTVQSRMVYDFARQSIRISWNAVLVPKMVGNRRNALYIDGISIYKMDSKSGKIVEHIVDKMIINDTPVTPPYGVLSALRNELMNPGHSRIPVGVGAMFQNEHAYE